MSNFNVSVKDDRDNILKELKLLENMFFNETDRFKSRQAFSLILCAWERVSKDLWEFGYWQDYFLCDEIVLRCTGVVEGEIFNEIGWNYMENENFADARGYFNLYFKIFETINYLDGQCQSIRYLGVLNHRQKLFGSALKSYRQALKIIANQANKGNELQVKQQAHLAEIHNLLGNFYFNFYDFPASFNELNLALKKYSSLGDEYIYYQAAPLLNLGRWHFIQGNYTEARRYYKECLRISDKINRTDTKVGVLKRLAELANAEGNTKKALRLTKKAQRISGEEIRKQREQVANLQEQLQGKRNIHFSVKNRLAIICKSGCDLAFYAPLTFVRFIIYYLTIMVKTR